MAATASSQRPSLSQLLRKKENGGRRACITFLCDHRAVKGRRLKGENLAMFWSNEPVWGWGLKTSRGRKMSRDLCLSYRESGVYFWRLLYAHSLVEAVLLVLPGWWVRLVRGPRLAWVSKTWRKSSCFLLVAASGRDCGLILRQGSFCVSMGKEVTSTGVRTTLQYLESATTRSVVCLGEARPGRHEMFPKTSAGPGGISSWFSG